MDRTQDNEPELNISHPVSFNMTYFDLCLKMSKEALDNGEVAIGCVFVDSINNCILATNRNRVNETKNATRHAEINCIDDIINNSVTGGSFEEIKWTDMDVYVSCEPCIQCARILRHLRVKRVIYGCSNDRFGGCRSVLKVTDKSLIKNEPELEYIHGVRCDEAIGLLRTFYEGENLNAPEQFRKIKQPKR